MKRTESFFLRFLQKELSNKLAGGRTTFIDFSLRILFNFLYRHSIHDYFRYHKMSDDYHYLVYPFNIFIIHTLHHFALDSIRAVFAYKLIKECRGDKKVIDVLDEINLPSADETILALAREIFITELSNYLIKKKGSNEEEARRVASAMFDDFRGYLFLEHLLNQDAKDIIKFSFPELKGYQQMKFNIALPSKYTIDGRTSRVSDIYLAEGDVFAFIVKATNIFTKEIGWHPQTEHQKSSNEDNSYVALRSSHNYISKLYCPDGNCFLSYEEKYMRLYLVLSIIDTYFKDNKRILPSNIEPSFGIAISDNMEMTEMELQLYGYLTTFSESKDFEIMMEAFSILNHKFLNYVANRNDLSYFARLIIRKAADKTYITDYIMKECFRNYAVSRKFRPQLFYAIVLSLDRMLKRFCDMKCNEFIKLLNETNISLEVLKRNEVVWSGSYTFADFFKSMMDEFFPLHDELGHDFPTMLVNSRALYYAASSLASLYDKRYVIKCGMINVAS
ncbi:MAG: hypothetical protein KatS3mg083_284 [Candidatus Dojkabacteria bacterium]|nr:MAG: hypothetical protein KatS3mg083_284 [Candidatus Dojkabacteria bacterium]